MRIHALLGACLLGAVLSLWPHSAVAQGPSAVRFTSLAVPEFECALMNCSGLAERRRSRLGRSVLVGALIGAGAGLLAGAIAGGFCGLDDSADARPCGETVALTFGMTAGTGALIGLIVGASEPSRGPVPTD